MGIHGNTKVLKMQRCGKPDEGVGILVGSAGGARWRGERGRLNERWGLSDLLWTIWNSNQPTCNTSYSENQKSVRRIYLDKYSTTKRRCDTVPGKICTSAVTDVTGIDITFTSTRLAADRRGVNLFMYCKYIVQNGRRCIDLNYEMNNKVITAVGPGETCHDEEWLL